jgi:hypothetical protein
MLIICRGRLERKVSVRISLAAEDMNLPYHDSTLAPTVATTGSISAMVCFLSLIGKPK